MTPRKVILLGAILLVAVSFVATVDFTTARDGRPSTSPCDPNVGRQSIRRPPCIRGQIITPATDHWNGWEGRRIWYLFGAGAILVLGAASVVAGSDRARRE